MRVQKLLGRSSDTQLLPLPVAIDLIRFEKNLLQMGFFGAHDTRHHNSSTRRIEQIVNREGQKIKVAAEFRGSADLGLPSTSDRDKYLAFMRIAMAQRAKQGQLTNPIRFTGYRLLKELGLCFSGENYEDINRWGQRMADTTITSEQVIYLAARRRYANKTVHVFRSFTRIGETGSDDCVKAESYEVVLEDWLLENLNESYVVPEDFNAYRKLKRPTGKGIFGYLHLWFHASRGKPIEKDYSELCLLLNIPAYKHSSKIKDTMGRSLDELVSIGYLSGWDVRPMLTKDGYKLVLLAGQELLHVLAISQRKQIGPNHGTESEGSAAQRLAATAMLERGISPAKADSLARLYDPEMIIDQIEYIEYLVSRDRSQRIDNPAGLIIYTIENRVPVPTGFATTRKMKERDLLNQARAADEAQELALRIRYDEWVDQQVDNELRQLYPGQMLQQKINEIVGQRVRTDQRYSSMLAQHKEELAFLLLKRDVKEDASLLTFDEWRQQTSQITLF